MSEPLTDGVGSLPVTEPPTHAPASLLANSAFMLLARGFTLVTGGALAIYAIRSFSVVSYGRYAIAVALITIIATLSEMGISALALRTTSYEQERAAEVLGSALAAEVVTTILAVVALFVVGIVLGYPQEVFVLLAIGSVMLLFQGLLPPVEAAFKARRIMVWVAVFSAVQSAVTAAVGFTLIALGAGPAGLLTALTIGVVAAVPTALVLLRTKLNLRPDLQGAWRRALPFLRASIPIALTGAITVIYERIDVLMVSKLDSTQAAAVYSVPLTVVQYALLVPTVIGTAFFPILVTLLNEDRPAASAPFFLLSRLFVFASAPIAVFLLAASDRIVTLVFGTRYAASGPVLAILALNVMLGFQIFLFWYGLLAAYRERGMAALMGLGLAVNLSLNAVLIPAYGPKGAAISLVVSDATILIGQATLLRRHVFAIPFVELLAKPLLATAATLPIVFLLRPTSNLIAAAVGALSFALVLLATRYVSRSEWEPLTVPVGAQLGRLRGKTTPSRP